MSSKINIEQLEEYLKQAGLENGKLEDVLSPIKELNNQRRYGLVWEEPDNSTYNTDSAEQELLKNFPFLKEVNEHRIFNGEEHPDHLLIEGDNLHALKTMQYTHKNKIDVIYIDPPYNTGNTDFVYNDKYVDSEDSWGHSKWLSFMNKRLRLARELMTDEGVIFISIDDNEYAQLKLLCDQVFGDVNRLSTFIWKTKTGAKGIPPRTMFTKTHEYVLAYSKKEGFRFQGLPRSTDGFSNPDKDPRGLWKRQYLQRFGQGFSKKTIVDPKTGDKYTFETPYTEDNMRIMVEEGRIIFPKDTSKYPARKEFYLEYANEGTPITSDLGLYSQKVASEKIKDLFGTKVFDYPKPVDLVKLLVQQHPNKNATVLDFFAGSGTTAHAVMELNKEDGGNRQAIVITNNEINDAEVERLLVEKGYVEPFTGRRGTKKYAEWVEKVNEFKTTPEYKELIQTDEYKDLGIARAVTEQRINKVINGYTTHGGKDVEGLDNNNFYHFEIVLEPDLMDDDLNTYMLINKTKDIIKVKEGVYTDEVDISTDNTPAIKLVNDEKEVIVVLSVRVTESDISQLEGNFGDGDKEHTIYTSYTGYDYGLHNINFKELPKELLQAIKHNVGGS